MNTIFNIAFNQEHQALLTRFQSSVTDKERLDHFVAIIWHYYEHHKRDFAWRSNPTPYNVLVSEIMLQQTQTYRVAEKFDPFIAAFPDFASLATAPFTEVLRLWKGLGYNRRALNLQKAAQFIVTEHNGTLPTNPTILQTFPSIGPATAHSIITYAFNQPTTFIETNVRTVFIYFFFKKHTAITDKMLEPLVTATADQHNPREWYYALMDYGVMLKAEVGNLSRLSAHYTKQSKFSGSDRQIRGMILQTLLDQPGIHVHLLPETLNKEPERVERMVRDLCKDGLVMVANETLWLANT